MKTVTEEAEILEFLQRADLNLEGEFVWGSNSTFFLTAVWGDRSHQVVYKPVKGERPLWDFPPRTLAKREVAAYLVSRALGWNFIPPTILRKKAPFGEGMLQVFIEHNPEYHYFSFSEADRERLRPIAVFDLLVNNADRKGSHILVDAEGELWCIDHGICFHVEEKLRTVIWDFAGQPIPASLLEDIRRVRDELVHKERWVEELALYFSAAEMNALVRRAEKILEQQVFPFPPNDRRPYPWPPI